MPILSPPTTLKRLSRPGPQGSCASRRIRRSSAQACRVAGARLRKQAQGIEVVRQPAWARTLGGGYAEAVWVLSQVTTSESGRCFTGPRVQPRWWPRPRQSWVGLGCGGCSLQVESLGIMPISTSQRSLQGPVYNAPPVFYECRAIETGRFRRGELCHPAPCVLLAVVERVTGGVCKGCQTPSELELKIQAKAETPSMVSSERRA